MGAGTGLAKNKSDQAAPIDGQFRSKFMPKIEAATAAAADRPIYIWLATSTRRGRGGHIAINREGAGSSLER